MGRPRNMENLFKANTVVKKHSNVKQGELGFDNQRENIDPHIKTKVVATQEGSIERTPTADNHIANKKYVDDSFPVTHASTTGQTTDDHHAETHTHKLNEIENPDASKTFNLGNNKYLVWTSVDRTPIAGEGIFNWETSGNFTGDLCHMHQHTGNAGAGTVLLKIEYEDVDITPLEILNGVPATIFKVDNSGNVTVAGTVDGIDIAVDVAANTTHRTSDGSNHTFINQDVTTTATPTFDEVDVNIIRGNSTFLSVGGAGTNSYIGTPGTDDTIFAGQVEFNQAAFFAGQIKFYNALYFADTNSFIMGNSNDASFSWNTSQTPNAFVFAVGIESRNYIICEQGDTAFDFAHAQETNPTVFIHSANQATDEWVSLTHNQTDGAIKTGTGDLTLLPATGYVGIGTTGPVTTLDVNADSIRVRTAQSPASNAAGIIGEIAWDANYIYIHVDRNTWKRAALTGGY